MSLAFIKQNGNTGSRFSRYGINKLTEYRKWGLTISPDETKLVNSLIYKISQYNKGNIFTYLNCYTLPNIDRQRY